MNIHLVVIVLLVAAGVACTGCPSTNPPPEPSYVVFPPYQEDAAPPSDTACTPSPLCRTACEALARVGCPESAPAGQSCSCVCALAEAQGIDLNLVCVSNASTVEQVRACGPRCLGR